MCSTKSGDIKMPYRILAVDDEEAIRVMLQQFLDSLGYETDTACDGVDGLEKMSGKSYDLVISDINMPRMKGFEFLQNVRNLYPKTRRVLITAYDVNEYLRMALKHDIGNIIAKTTPFNFDETKTVVNNILTGSFFGLERYIDKSVAINKSIINRHEQIEELSDRITGQISDEKKSSKLALVFIEVLTNAVYYGGRNEKNLDKTKWKTRFVLPDNQAIHVSWATDSEKFGFSVVDQAGRLRKQDVIHWLCRQTEKDDSGLPKGVFDSHGRGFFIARSYVDSLIINIVPEKQTEIIALAYHDKDTEKHKPLYINEM
jgi:CheY-like chemotaxis protein